MADVVIKENESIVPFFGQRLSFIRGLDPLGLQNTSEVTFSRLLPGLNNVTGRIRYYSFYCWLLDTYSKTIGSTNPKKQKQFIRRAEYIIALAANYFEGNNASIPGINYAKNEIYDKELTEHDLQEGTFKSNGSTEATYWKYGTGAFGQYYLGSLRDIGLIIEREKQTGLYARTNKRKESFISGEDLAKAFDNNIPSPQKVLFLSCISKGQITERQLKELLPSFDLTRIPEDSVEQDLLIKLLLQRDYPLRIEELPSLLRQETIQYLLHYLNTSSDDFSTRAFVYNCYDLKGISGGATDQCLMGWYFYQFNEFWHYANTSILNGTLAYLEDKAGPNWMLIPQLIDQVKLEVIQKLIELDIVLNEDSTVNEIFAEIPTDYTEYNAYVDTSSASSSEKVAHAFLLLFKLFLNNSAQLMALKEYAESNYLARDGEGSSYFYAQFNTKREFSISNFIHDYIYLNIIYRHQYVAFRKIGGGSQSTQKFIIEEQHIRYLGNFRAAFTGPRLGNLVGFLKDLGIITVDDQLSSTGISLLNDLQHVTD